MEQDGCDKVKTKLMGLFKKSCSGAIPNANLMMLGDNQGYLNKFKRD